MTRRSGRSRVTAAGSAREQDRRSSGGVSPLPPMRKRRPWIYWTVVVATFAMVLTTFAAVISAFV